MLAAALYSSLRSVNCLGVVIVNLRMIIVLNGSAFRHPTACRHAIGATFGVNSVLHSSIGRTTPIIEPA
jgi:hypothetical protein